MRLLGAILRGGQSRRFGSDKALALLDGRPLLDHVIERLRPQAAELVLCGGPADPRLAVIQDQPAPGLGPLAGLLAALDHAAASGFDAVLTAPCDAPLLPSDLADRLAPGPAIACAGERLHPVFGLWPAGLAPQLRGLLATDERRLMRWAEIAGARHIMFENAAAFANINDPAALAALHSGRKN